MTSAAPSSLVDHDELDTLQLTTEDWLQATITIPETIEAEQFGRAGKKEPLYQLYVNGRYYHTCRYADFQELYLPLKKKFRSEMTKLKFPKKTRSSSGDVVDVLREHLAAWIIAVAKIPDIVDDDAFHNFVTLTPNFDVITADVDRKSIELATIEEDKWNQRCEKKGVKLWTLGEKLDGSKFLVVRTFVKVAAPMQKCFTIYNTKKEWANWQKELEVCETIETIEGEETDLPCREVIYARYKAPTGVSNRDVALFCYRYAGSPTDKGNSKFVTVLNQSIHHRGIPQVRGVVRGHMNISQTTFESVDDGTATEVKSILHMNPRGMLPAWLVNALATSATDSIIKMKVYIETKR